VVSLGTVAINIAANLWLVRVMGFRGLALGTSLAMLVNGIALLLLLRHRLEGLEDRLLTITFCKILVAALVMAAVSSGTLRLAEGAAPSAGSLAQAARLFAAIGTGLVALAATARLLHIRQFDDAVATAKARLM
jgi:putative peptidoglycan lipid II flippase